MGFRPTQYTRGERAIRVADGNTIRERWLWGLRLLRDPQAMTPNGNLRHGVIERLVQASRAHEIVLGEREIQRRLTCARTYPTEDQIRLVQTDFGTWSDLYNANFPPREAPSDATIADHRTTAEKRRDLARALADIMDGQESLFPLDQFEPQEATLKDLGAYIDDQDRITEGFIAANDKRKTYRQQMLDAVGGDESKTWLEGHQAAFGRREEA